MASRAVVRCRDYTRVVPSSSLQALLTRAGAALLRGRGAEAAQLAGARFSLHDADARRRARRPLDDGRSDAAPGRSRPGGSRPRPSARYLSRYGAVAPPLDIVAAARPSGVGARRSVARHRPARPRAEARGDRPRFDAPSASPITSSASATGRSAISRSCASTSPRRPPRCMPPAIAVTSRWCTRCRACRSPSWAATRKRWPRCGRPNASRPWCRRTTCSPSSAETRRTSRCCSTTTSRRWRSPSAASRCTKRTARATGSRWRSRRSDRSASASGISAVPKRRCTARSTSAARFSFTKRPAPSSTRSPRFT